ncbi:Imm21 family immunity protein [Phocaeicola sartorii]|uniref:Imm21 family immunity protein n=1 Tax=Phocaeicola sartorii TaxID=671267 RepID=UPI0025583304|nr:Imm21 family immunity protein [Phocaeicola sartorii]
MNNWIETSGSPFVIVEQQYAHQWNGLEDYNAICSVTDYMGKICKDNHVLLVMGDEPMATRIVKKDGAILIIRWMYAPDYLTVERLLENDIVAGLEPIEKIEVKWDSTELVLFDSLSRYCETSVKKLLSLQKTSCIIKTYHYQKGEVSLIIHSIQ